MKSKLQVLALSALLLFATSGCSAFVGSTQSISITASEPNADIWVDGQQVGRGSVSMEVARNKSHSFMAKVGDRTGVAQVGTKISATGVLDIIGGIFFLIPLIGIATPGFWELDQTSFTIQIPPSPSPAPATTEPAEPPIG